MYIVQYLVVPYVRGLSSELYLECMTSIYAHATDGKSLFQYCRDAVSVQNNTSSLPQEEDPPTIAASFGLMEMAYHKLDKESMTTGLLSPTPAWVDPKTNVVSSPEVVPQKTLNTYLVTHCRRHSWGEWENIRNKETTLQQHDYSLMLRQVAYNCLAIMGKIGKTPRVAAIVHCHCS